jgi:hypothetical protein
MLSKRNHLRNVSCRREGFAMWLPRSSFWWRSNEFKNMCNPTEIWFGLQSTAVSETPFSHFCERNDLSALIR